MKKLAIMAALVVSSMAASAVEYSAFTKYDYDRLSDHHSVSAHRAVVGLKADFNKWGALDAGVAHGRVSAFGHSENGNGYDIGYSNGVSIGKLGLSARVGASKFDDVKLRSLALEASHPLNDRVTGFIGAEHLRGTIDGFSGHAGANRVTLGTNIALNTHTTFRVGYAHTDVNGSDLSGHGLTSALVYKF